VENKQLGSLQILACILAISALTVSAVGRTAPKSVFLSSSRALLVITIPESAIK
jgi:hypothetical protein